MPRITTVAKAQQRYATKVVKDDRGRPIRTPVMRRDGTQKTTKSGKPVYMTKTVADKSRPLPLEKCDYCNKPIEVGSPYKHMTPKSGPYGGRKRSRHIQHPSWQVWEYSSSLSARIAQIVHDGEASIADAETTEDLESVLHEIADEIRSLADEKAEGADNIEAGFGHETEQSQELREISEQLESWAEEVENVNIPDYPEAEEEDCPECGGTGHREIDGEQSEEECDECEGTGQVTPEEPTDEQVNEWRDEAMGVAQGALDSCPV